MRIAYLGAHQSVHTRRWVEYFVGRGHDVHLLSCGVSHHPVTGYTVHDLGVVGSSKVGYFGRIPLARRILREIDPHVVHAHYATSYGTIAAGARVRPLIITAHGDDVLVAVREPARRLMVKRVLRSADLVTVPSDHMKAAVDRLRGRTTPPVLVFQYGVETARLAALADEVRVTTDAIQHRPLSIVSARPLMDPYRVDVLVDALVLLAQRNTSFTCDILGDGPDRARMSAVVERAGLTDAVRFLGNVPSTTVESCFARADVAVSLSSRDGASLAVLEAMATGSAAVLSDIPANRPWVDPDGAVLVGTRPVDVADGIERAAALDAAAARRANRRLVLERADLPTNLRRFETVMETLAGRDPIARGTD